MEEYTDTVSCSWTEKNLTHFHTGGFKAGRIMRLFPLYIYDFQVI